MRRSILFLSIIWFCFGLTFNAESQQRRKQIPPQQKTSPPPKSTSQQPIKKTAYCFRRKTDSTEAPSNKAEASGACAVIEGKIEGVVAQKEKLKEIKENGKTTYEARYVLLDGGDIDLISEDGIQGHGYYTVILSSRDKQPPDDVQIIEYVKSNYTGGLMVNISSDSPLGTVGALDVKLSTLRPDEIFTFSLGGRTMSESDMPIVGKLLKDLKGGKVRFPLLGEFRRENGKSQIIPALRITTEKGEVVIPANEIIEFKK